MPKEEVLEFPGLVTELLPNAMFRVELDNGHKVFSIGVGQSLQGQLGDPDADGKTRTAVSVEGNGLFDLFERYGRSLSCDFSNPCFYVIILKYTRNNSNILFLSITAGILVMM